jgi:predicted CXXCH cytochrome family protein
MGVERQEKPKREALLYSVFFKAIAVGASLLFLCYLSGCAKTVSQDDIPSPEHIASEIEQESIAQSGQNVVTVSYPADMAVMEYNPLSLSLSLLQSSTDSIEVEVNSQIKARIAPRRNVECLSVALEPGINKINIIAKKKDRIVDEVALNIFRRSDLVGNYEKPPAGFEKDYFHMKDRYQCAACHHLLQPAEADGKTINIETYTAGVSKDKPVVPADSSCYSCHRGITSYSFVHGPGIVWSCLTCHDARGEPRYSLRYPVPELCYKCHVEQKQQRSGKKNYHAPYITDKCGMCHNPHASDNPSGLERPILLLCESCHPGQADGRHIVASYFWGTRHRMHPTHGVPDPSRKGHELSCASCHDPHASDFPMFISKYDPRNFDLCKKCHYSSTNPTLYRMSYDLLSSKLD